MVYYEKIEACKKCKGSNNYYRLFSTKGQYYLECTNCYEIYELEEIGKNDV